MIVRWFKYYDKAVINGNLSSSPYLISPVGKDWHHGGFLEADRVVVLHRLFTDCDQVAQDVPERKISIFLFCSQDIADIAKGFPANQISGSSQVDLRTQICGALIKFQQYCI